MPAYRSHRTTQGKQAAAARALSAREDGGWKAVGRERKVSRALRAHAALACGAAHGAVRDPGLVDGQ